MAEGKSSFILYSDQRGVIDLLSDEQAGRLLKHIFGYINDENPVLEDLTLQIAFEPIKQQLKRDLDKWRDIKDKRSEAGRKGGLKKQKEANQANASSAKQEEANQAVNVTVTVNDNESVINSNAPDRRPLNLDHVKSATKGICKRKKRNIDETKVAEDFYTHYQANNWTHNNDPTKPIHDWIAKLEQWIGRENEKKAVKHDPDLP